MKVLPGLPHGSLELGFTKLHDRSTAGGGGGGRGAYRKAYSGGFGPSGLGFTNLLLCRKA